MDDDSAHGMNPVAAGVETVDDSIVSGAGTGLLDRAEHTYRGVVADPKTFGPGISGLVDEARALRHHEALIVALRAQAWFERAHLHNSHAKKLLDEAVRLARRHALWERLYEVLVTRAAVNHELGALASAKSDLHAAAGVIHECGDADLLFQQAVLCQSLGEVRESAALYRAVLSRDETRVDLRVKSANNLAIIEIQLGHPDVAFELVDSVTGTAARLGPALAAVLASTRAWITTVTGRLPAGLIEFDRAAALHKDADIPLAELYLEYVDALVDLRLIPEAFSVALRAVDAFEQQAVHLMAAEGMLRVARLALLSGDVERAHSTALEARNRFAGQRRRAWRARADVLLGEISLQSSSDLAHALVATRRAAVALDRLGMTSHATDAYLVAGRIALALSRRAAAAVLLDRAGELAKSAPVLHRLKGRLALALAAPSDRSRLLQCRAGLRDLDQHRAAFASVELRIRASGHGAELGRIGLTTLLRTGTARQVLGWMERTRAAALVAVDPLPDVDIDTDVAALQAVRADLVQSLRAEDDEPTGLLNRQLSLENRIRRLTSGMPDAGARAATSEALSDTLDAFAGRILVEYGVEDGRVFAVVVDSGRMRLVALGAVAEVQLNVAHLLFALRRLARGCRSDAATRAAMGSARSALRQLGALVVAPLGLPPEAPVAVSPTGDLRFVPWAALFTAPVSVIPAASFWRRTSARADPGESVLLVAGPGLPGAVQEITELRKLHPAATVLAPPESTIDTVVAALGRADLVHMACHGNLRTDNPAFSSLQLQDGNLTLHELDVRRVAPHRLVISACEVALDTPYDGNEVLGFVSALMARGTCGLVASVVAVPDAASVPFMVDLHARLRRGDHFDTALFVARSRLDREDPAELVNWCAFNAYGAA